MANAYVSSDFDDKYFSIHKDFYESYDVTTKPCADNFEICDDLFEKDPYMCHEYTSDSDDVDIDVAEEKRIQTFFKNGCRCEFGSSKTQCSDFISVKVIEDLRSAMQEALREEKDMASDVSRGIWLPVYRYGRPNYRRPNNCQVKKKKGP